MKYIYIYFLALVLFSCNGNKENKIGTDIVNNPKTAGDKKSKGKGPQLTFQNTSQSFGTIKSNAPVELVFMFTNTGDEPLLLTNVQAGCSCTTPNWPKDPIEPGKEAYIKAVFDPTGKGSKEGENITKTISVQSNSAKDNLQTLTITGKVIEVIN